MPSLRITVTLLLCLSLGFAFPAFVAHAQAPFVFTTVDVPGATHTEVAGSDGAGNLVGSFADSRGRFHGFRKANGIFTTINFPGSTATHATSTDLNGIFVVGWYTDSKFVPHGFQLQLSSGVFKTINVPNAIWTRAFAITSLGTIAGAYADTTRTIHGFLDTDGLGTFTTLDEPGARHTEIHSIANLRYMAGIFFDSSGVEHGVQGASGVLSETVNVPGAAVTSADGINDAINIVGHCATTQTGPFHGYLLVGGQFQTIDFPGATDTRCIGISDDLVIVGRFTDTAGKVHGFIAK